MLKSPDFVINIIKNFWKPGQKILEIGCGPAFLRELFGEDYIGTDITDEPYNKNLPRNVDIVCSADDLLIKSESVDVVVIKSAFYLFPNHRTSLNEALRVLKPGGQIIIFDYNRKTQKGLQRKESHDNYPCWTQRRLKKFVQQNGFKNVKNLLAENDQPTSLNKYYRLIKQEFFGTWAIVCGTK
jgi:ubiquinone/menaquinone biosynthesis C-methylase UbiE